MKHQIVIKVDKLFDIWQVVVWKVICQNGAKQPGSHAEDHLQLNGDEGFSYPGPNYKDALISRLVGHEGSIFRIAWFSNGTKLVSVSDDRRWVTFNIYSLLLINLVLDYLIHDS